MKLFFHHVSKKLLWCIIILLVLFALVISAARIATPFLSQYRPELEQWAGQLFKREVTIGDIKASWRGFTPIVILKDLDIQSMRDNERLLSIDEIDVGLSLWSSLWHWRLEPAFLHISGATLNFNQNQESGLLLGYDSDGDEQKDSGVTIKKVFAWLFSQRSILLRDITVNITTDKGLFIPISDLNISVLNKGESHHIQGHASVVQKVNSQLDFLLDMNGNIDEPEKLHAKFYLQAQDIALKQWLSDHKFLGLQLQSGYVENFELWANWREQTVKNVQATLRMNRISSGSALNQDTLLLKNLSANLAWKRTAIGSWHLVADNINIETTQQAWPETELQLSRELLADKSIKHSLALSYLPLSDLRLFYNGSTLIPAIWRDRISRLNPQGYLHDVSLGLLLKEGSVDTWHANAMLDNLSWQRLDSIPGVQQLSGDFVISPKQGSLQLNSQDFSVDFGNLFIAPLTMNQLKGDISWQQQTDQWHVIAKNMAGQNAQVKFHANASTDIPSNGDSPTVNLLAGYENLAVVNDISMYLPVGIMGENLTSWLNAAIPKADTIKGSVVLQGRLSDFPFDNGTGSFIAQGDVKGVELHYLDDWPNIDQLSGEMVFDRRSMKINIDSGQVLGGNIQQATADIADMTSDNPQLMIKGKLQGDLQQGADFLTQSPLDKQFGKALAHYDLSGEMQTDLVLGVPLGDDDADVSVKGNIHVKDADVNMPEWKLALSHVEGDLVFTEQGLSAQGVSAQLLGEPLLLNLVTVETPEEPSYIQATIDGTMDVVVLQDLLGLKLDNIANGESFYHATIKVPDGDTEQAVQIQVSSDLEGIAVIAPTPFGKSYTQPAATFVQLELPSEKPSVLRFQYAHHLSGILQLKSDTDGWQLVNGDIRFGSKQVHLPKSGGLTVNGYLPVLSLTEWQSFVTQLMPVSDTVTPEHTTSVKSSEIALLQQMDIRVGKLDVIAMTLDDILLRLQPQKTAWQLYVDNSIMQGKIWIPYTLTDDTIIASFNKMSLPKAETKTTKANSHSATNVTPQDIPSMNVKIDDFSYGDRKFKQVGLIVKPQKNQLKIDSLTLKGYKANLAASGYWRSLPSGTETFIQGKLKTKNYGELLKYWQLSKNIEGENGTIEFELSWPEAPYEPNMNQAVGRINVNLEAGRVIDLGSSSSAEVGVGKALNLLSLSTLTRRLKLDFSDLYKKGFSFDSLNADIRLNKGVAVLEDVDIKGPIAKITARGDVDLIQQQYNLRVNVTPYVTSSIPIAAAIATGAIGGPIVGGAVGAAAWVANQLIAPGVAKLITYHYKVTGSWDDPKITEVSRSDIKDSVNQPNSSTTNKPTVELPVPQF